MTRKVKSSPPRKRWALPLATETAYPIDYDAYDTQEIIVLVEFLAALEDFHENPSMPHEPLLEQYKHFRNIINNQAEEKRIDNAFYKQTGIRIYQTMQALKEHTA